MRGAKRVHVMVLVLIAMFSCKIAGARVDTSSYGEFNTQRILWSQG